MEKGQPSTYGSGGFVPEMSAGLAHIRKRLGYVTRLFPLAIDGGGLAKLRFDRRDKVTQGYGIRVAQVVDLESTTL